ncbi:helix-turn-helix transcriptional regulator [Spirosoma sp. KCTC 42546]|uniref:winged helix-turn-helix transcriptional regulator n=1 Tax=Spirosoma sp. KCTC 42546 TaxID=2520506 RepID=UPI0011582A88|nr:helix-turn-helix domain-containing protein [Spirosoma sp. KCTC 42546]QDK81983.1 helix-turn-helix transcriptional regulator [Spirosoma sp. KCTC 42546]
MILTEGDTKTIDCIGQMLPIRDALDVISGKWKVLILTSVMQGNRRFTEIQASIPKINPKVLSKELKDMEEHQLIQRIVHDSSPVLIEYVATEYSRTLKRVMMELHAWGVNHRKQLFGK